MDINLNIKKSSINSASSKVKIAYKNLELYDKGEYKVSEEKYKKIISIVSDAKRNK